MGLGPTHTVTLAEARQKALESRKLRLEGHDPIAERRTRRTVAKLEAAKAITFRECADVSISAEVGPGFSGQLGPIPAVEERSSPESMEGDPRATRRALTSDGAARVGRRVGPRGRSAGLGRRVRRGS
jgi:hypothetical protein